MTTRLPQIVAGLLLTLALAAAPAQAQTNRTWVSGLGADAGACTVTAPCSTFAYAQTQTAVPGEIDVLDPGDFGPVNITSSLSIVSDGGGVAGIGITAGNGITISAGASDSVHVRGLVINGSSSASNGINIVSGANVAIENCVIRGFTGAGILVSTSMSSFFSVSNTITSNNNVGILVEPSAAAAVNGALSNVTANNNQNAGIAVNGGFTTATALNVTIADSEASSNVTYGVAASSTSGNAAPGVMLRNVVASYNGTGIIAQANTTVWVSQSVVTGNGVGVTSAGTGIVDSYGDNNIDGNTGNGSWTTIVTH